MPRLTTGFICRSTGRADTRAARSITATALHGSSNAKYSSTSARRPARRRTAASRRAGPVTLDRAMTVLGTTLRVITSTVGLGTVASPPLCDRAAEGGEHRLDDLRTPVLLQKVSAALDAHLLTGRRDQPREDLARLRVG